MNGGHCWFCAAPLWTDETFFCSHCGMALDEYGFWWDYADPYDDEADLAYSDTARGEEAAPQVSTAHNNPRYPPRQG